ncbi:cell cycle checkpoint protein RAD17 [Anopheles cruzii]|uniref:cell cycle checkpoint protein RAD17 n=1 Tax=Anopheles cruzii TaxID=68878 RepID=UPI0022EC80B2|nr:cell cycle checkpoint protein RAD17 [Anopheles cruzii]
MQSKRNADLIQQFEPSKETDLAIHVKKIEEIKHWLLQQRDTEQNDAKQILLVTGPSGSGKSICVKTIAKQLQFDVMEWVTPVDVELFYDDQFDFDGREHRKSRPSQKQQFVDFLHKSSRYCSLFSSPGTDSGRLLLVKDFPNSLLRTPSTFHDTLEQYRERSTTPIVFITTDASSKTLDVALNLFPPSVVEGFQIHTIKFNAVSVSLMRKAVKRISGLIKDDTDLAKRFRVPPKDIEENIIASSQGDLRNCCLNYLFSCLKSGSNPKFNPMVPKSGPDTKRGKSALGLGENLTLMHGLGRILHPKYVKNDATSRFLHAPEDIGDCFVTQPTAIISLLHSNYVTRCSDVHCLAAASDALTMADVIMNEYRTDQLAVSGLNLAVRGIMVNNEQTAHSWFQIKKKITIQQHCNTPAYTEEFVKAGLIIRPVTPKLFAAEYKGFVSLIQNETNKINSS